jgi:hypothetical protein
MSTTEEQFEITNVNSLNYRKSLISTASVVGNGRKSVPLDFSSESSFNPLLTTKEINNVNELFPSSLRDDIQTIVSLIQKYFEFENISDHGGNAKYINTLHEIRNIDAIDIDNSIELRKWFFEFSRSSQLLTKLKIDPRTYLKYISTMLQQKGTFDGARSFFRLIYNKAPIIYIPWEDVLITSDGEWNGEAQYRISLDGSGSELKGFVLSKGTFATNDGFLSENKVLQDSYYYQQYSYDIKIDEPGYDWDTIFKELMHPAGFLLFSTFILILFAEEKSQSLSMPYFQYGKIDILTKLVNILIQTNTLEFTANDVFILLKFILISISSNTGITNNKELSTRFIFYDTTTIEEYGDLSIAGIETGVFNTGSYIIDVGSP